MPHKKKPKKRNFNVIKKDVSLRQQIKREEARKRESTLIKK